MINMLSNFIKKKTSLEPRKEKLFKALLNLEENTWLMEDRYHMKALWLLINAMSEKHIKFFSNTYPILFLKSTGRLASSIHQLKNRHIVLVYPQTISLMSGIHFEKAVAILAHELGHIYYEHGKSNLSPLQTQVQADQFAADLGFGLELQEVLLENGDFIECRVRVSYLTSRLITSDTKLFSDKLKSS